MKPEWSTLRPMPMPAWLDHYPVVVGHRGASGLAPENTLAAFRLAIELKIDGIELDVQRSSDGELVVFHDDELDRTTDGTGALLTKTLEELKKLDAGRWFDQKFAGERIPTLRETFELCRDARIIIHIELKDPFLFPGIERQVIDLIREFNFVERCQLRSFDHESLLRAYEIAPEMAFSELWYHQLPGDDETNFRTINAYHELYNPEAIVTIHQRGQKATAWTVNDPEVARRLIEAGVDGLTTDYPDRLLKLVYSLRQ